MNLKLKAAGIAVSVIGTGFFAGFVMSYLPTWAVLSVIVLGASYVVYSTALTGLKYDQSIEEINKKYQK
jgi:hypothetical protein